MKAQLALNLRLRDGSSFDNFLAGANREALAQTQAAARRPMSEAVYLYGEPATGKTHLLEAACRLAQENGVSAVYVPLREGERLAPAMLDDLDDVGLVCLDDLERIAGHREWERAAFRMWEARRGRGVLVAAAAPPARLGLQLPDLVTRLSTCAVYLLKGLSDEQKIAAVCGRAARRGLELGEDVARYLLNRYPRDLASLFALLERIDAAALARQRRVTIPFLRTMEDR